MMMVVTDSSPPVNTPPTVDPLPSVVPPPSVEFRPRSRRRPKSSRSRRPAKSNKNSSVKIIDTMTRPSTQPSVLRIPSTPSTVSLDSKRSNALSLMEQSSFKHMSVLVTFDFGLLTSQSDCPRQGPYLESASKIVGKLEEETPKREDRLTILDQILKRADLLSTNALEEMSGNVVMICNPERPSYVTFVQRDYKYKSPKNRPGVVRCVVSAVMPVTIASDGGTFTDSSKVVAKVVVRKALIEGIEKKQLYG